MRSIPVIIILPIVLAIGLLITVISVILYKRHLNNVVAGSEHNLHSKIIEPNTVLRTTLICILAIWLVILTINFSTLLSEISNLRQQSQQMNDLINEIYSDLWEMNDKIDAQNSICEDYDFSFGKVDAEKKTVEMVLKVWLKEYSENTVVTVNFDGNSEILKNNNGVFTGSFAVDLFADYETTPVLTVETDSVVKSQKLEQWPYEKLCYMVFPTVVYTSVDDGYNIRYERDGNMVVSGKMTVFEDGSRIEGITLTSASLIYAVDGKVVKEIPLSFVNGAIEAIDISGSFPVEKNCDFSICIKGKNNLGYTVIQRIIKYDWQQKGDVSLDGDLAIFDEKGNLAFSDEK